MRFEIEIKQKMSTHVCQEIDNKMLQIFLKQFQEKWQKLFVGFTMSANDQ